VRKALGIFRKHNVGGRTLTNVGWRKAVGGGTTVTVREA
jgi:hypothetical protein